jgi:hypothetical protein
VSALSDLVDEFLDDRSTPIMLSPKLWSVALLEQARQDLMAAEILATNRGSACVIAMLLQMYFEKLAKAALARTDINCFKAYRTSHVAASRLISTLKNHGRYVELHYAWKDILPLIQNLERAHPAIAKRGPHLEYPWEQGDRMGLPQSDLQIVRNFEDPTNPVGPKLFRFARELSNRFDELFA